MKLTRLLILTAILALVGLPAKAQNVFRLLPEGRGAFSSMIREAPTYVDARVLAAGVSETHTIPTGAQWVLFSSDCNFYAKPGSSAAVASDVTNGTASELNPAAWRLDGSATQITVISATACNLTMSFYK